LKKSNKVELLITLYVLFYGVQMRFGEVDQRTDIRYSQFQSSSTVRYISLMISQYMSIDFLMNYNFLLKVF